jgi:NAD(P)H dehydrogenase (quinone)
VKGLYQKVHKIAMDRPYPRRYREEIGILQDMNILIVTAHPSKFGDTHTIARTYADAKKAKGHTVEILDLYAKSCADDLLCFERIREMAIGKVQQKFHEQVLWAHEIVVVHPVWWSMPPAIMKNWVDLTFWPGVAYKYMPDGKVSKMLKGKTAKVFATCGGQSWYYYFYFLPLLSFWKIAVFYFSGVELIDFKVCGKMDTLQAEDRSRHLQKFLAKVKASA